jgi:uncharacterized protein YkwD
MILVTAAILTVQPSSMLQPSYAQSLSFQSCPDGSTPDASGNCPTLPPPAGDGETAEAPPPAGDGETAEAPPPAGDGETAEAPPATETPPPAAPPATETPPPAAPPAGGGETQDTLDVPSNLAPPATETPPPAAPPATTPYVVNKNSSAYLTGYNFAISYGIGGPCVSLSNTSSVQDDCAYGYLDGITTLNDPAFQQSADFVKGMLAAHNRERHLVGLPDYVWDKELAAGSKAWAEHLSQTGELVHDYGNVEAENIADGLNYAASVWILEKDEIQKKYQGGPVSQFIESLTQDERHTAGHYLIMISPTLKAVGCGTAQNPHPIAVCRYSAEGVAQAPGP